MEILFLSDLLPIQTANLVKNQIYLLTCFVSSKNQNIDEYMEMLLKSVFYKTIKRIFSILCKKSYM